MKRVPSESCAVCGNEPEECICAMAPDFPDDLCEGIEDDDLDWDFYQEYNDEVDRKENLGEAGADEGQE